MSPNKSVPRAVFNVMMCTGSATLLTLRLRTRLGKKVLGTNSPMKSHKTNKKAFLIKEKCRHIKIFQG